MNRFVIVIPSLLVAGLASAELINEFEPNPAGADPDPMSLELSGDVGASFDLWILSIENDGINGTVDRASNVTGSFDANGLAVVSIPDFENPSNTVILTDSFSGSIGDDLDADDDGTLELGTLGTILDAVGVSDNAGDDATMYASGIGGTDILFNGEFEPLLVFRDSVTGDWYQTVTVDFGEATERIGAFPASGSGEIATSAFSPDASSTTYGAINPTLVPEPASAALLGLGAVCVLRRRR